MKYIGIFLLLIAAAATSREYSKYMRKRALECKAFLSFIAHMRVQVGCFLRPVKELAAGFSSPVLEKAGFIRALGDSDCILSAYKRCEPALSLSEEEKSALGSFFSSFGEGYLDDGMKLIEGAYSDMSKLYEKLCAEKTKNTRLVTALSATSALGIIIFVI